MNTDVLDNARAKYEVEVISREWKTADVRYGKVFTMGSLTPLPSTERRKIDSPRVIPPGS